MNHAVTVFAPGPLLTVAIERHGGTDNLPCACSAASPTPAWSPPTSTAGWRPISPTTGVRVVADLAGEYMNAVLDGGVAFLKVSHEELIEANRAPRDSVPALSMAARQLRQEGAAAVLISRSHQPSLALLDDVLYQVDSPSLQAADHRGAGDSMTAAVAAVLSQGGDLADAVRTGAAAGAVNVTRHGLGTGQAETVKALVERVRLTELDDSA